MSEVTGSIQDVTIRANNIAVLRAFYRNLGFREVMVRADDFVVFAFGKSELVLYRVDDRPTAAVGLGFLVDDTAPIGQRLRAASIPFEGPMALRPGMFGIRLTDPSGNVVELFRPEL